MLEKLFKTNIQRHVEKLNKLENETEILKTQQKVKYEGILDEYEAKKTQYQNNVDAQIISLQNQIENLKVSKVTQVQAYEKEKYVELKKVDNEFDQKILSKNNEITKLRNLIDKEQKDMANLINPVKANAPKNNKKVLLENQKAIALKPTKVVKEDTKKTSK